MKRNINRCIFPFLLIFSWFFPGQAIYGQELPARDSSEIRARTFDSKVLDEFKGDSDFNYKTILEPADSLWDRFWNFIWRMMRRMLSTEEGSATATWSLRILAIAGLAFFIWQLTKMRAAGVFSSAKSRAVNYSILNEDIHGIDFEKEIADAEAAGNYRFAVRMLYLRTLKKLSDSGLIDWRIEKTNLNYLEEVKQTDFYALFSMLTIRFENTWYGNMPIPEDQYLLVQTEFQTLHYRLPS